jgi:hypothetical protein
MKIEIKIERECNGKIYKEHVVGDTDKESPIGLGTYEHYATRLLQKCLRRLNDNIYRDSDNPNANISQIPNPL